MSVQPLSTAGAAAIAGNQLAQFQGSTSATPLHAPSIVNANPPVQPLAQDTAVKEPSPSALQQALDEVQSVIRPVAQDLQFSVEKDTGKTVVKIVDSATDEVIRQIPSEELIAISKALDKLQGLLVKQQA